jgi:oligoendopeptidase F
MPATAQIALEWGWDKYAAQAKALTQQQLTAANCTAWLADWTQLASLIDEVAARLVIASTADTTDKAAEARYNAYLEGVQPQWLATQQTLRELLLQSGLQPAGMEIPLRNMRAEAALFREANLPLLTEEKKLGVEYDQTIGAQTVQWEGSERTLSQLQPVYQDPDRARRERAWRLAMQRRLTDRPQLNALWQKFLRLRGQLAANAGLNSYRDYAWQDRLRFDYTPQDCASFHTAIERVVVPAASRIYERRRQRLGLQTLRPWDLEVDVAQLPALRPFTDAAQLVRTSSAIFNRINPQLGEMFDTLDREQLLDLDNRKGKAPGAYCTGLPLARRTFIFMNSVGIHDDVQTLLHEAGHAFQDFHIAQNPRLPFAQQWNTPLEFCEVASMAMELLAAPHLTAADGGFYSTADAARARTEHLEGIVLFWPYMAVVDAFQHWVYEHAGAAADPAQCDAQWARLWQRFMPGIDYSGMEDILATGWHRKLHIFQVPFYYIEYGLAQLGAVQIWRNAIKDKTTALAGYRAAIALGGSVPLPQLFAAAGARFAFDAPALQDSVALLEQTLADLEAQN